MRFAIGLVLCAAVAFPARADDKPAIAFAGAFDDSEIDPAITRMFESAVKLSRRYAFIDSSAWRSAAEKAGVELAATLHPPALTTTANAVGASAVIVATVVSGDSLATRIELAALDPDTGRTLSSGKQQVSIDFGSGASSIRVSPREAAALVSQVINGLHLHARPPAPPSPSPSATTPSATPSAPAPGAPAVPSTGAAPAPTPSAASAPTTSAAPASAASKASSSTVFSEEEGEPPLDQLLLVSPDLKIGATAFVSEWVNFTSIPQKIEGRHDVDGALQLAGTAPLYTASVRLLARQDFADASRNRLEAEEAWVEIGHWGLRLRAGRNIVIWDPQVTAGTPASPITPVDGTDVAHQEALPIYNVRLAYDVGPVTVEGYYLPVPARSIANFLPQDSVDGRFASADRWFNPAIFEKTVFKDTAAVPVTLDPLAPPPPTLGNAQAAARAVLSLDWLRLSLAYGYVLALLPSFSLGGKNADGTTAVHVNYARQHLLDFTWVINQGWFNAGIETTMTAKPDFSSIDANATSTFGMSVPTFAELHRIGGGVFVVTKLNLLPGLPKKPGDSVSSALLGATVEPYLYYGLGRFELKTVFLQKTMTAPSFVNLTQLSAKIGVVTPALGVVWAYGAPKSPFGSLGTTPDRVELSVRASL